MITLTPKQEFKVPIDLGCLIPDAIIEKSIDEIRAFRIWEGNRNVHLETLFKISKEADTIDDTIHFTGDLRKTRRIGAKMSRGKIVIDGDVGSRLGEEMKGGTIIVNGNADSWVGSMMRNGEIEVKGDIGDYAGSAYRGSTKGMKGGKIIAHGNAGNETGCFMRGGVIKIYGNVGIYAGIHMNKGTIFIQGNSEGRLGAQMLQGKIIVSGKIPSILPTFTVDNIVKKTKLSGEEIAGPFYTFIGDVADNGRGKIYISQTHNPHLKQYEKFL